MRSVKNIFKNSDPLGEHAVMLLKLHRQYTQNALSHVQVADEAAKKEILVGCTANDLCEFTNEMQVVQSIDDLTLISCLLTSKDVIWQFLSDKPDSSPSALFNSHLGELASLHAMAKKAQEEPESTRGELVAWFEFLNGVALGTIQIDSEANVFGDDVPVSAMFSLCQDIKYRNLFDSRNAFEIRNRAVGMMCHLIQDLFTSSHCQRNSQNELVKFFYYRLQNKEKHKKGDHAVKSIELARQCKLCIEAVKKSKIPYDYGPVLVLSKDAKKSDGGSFA